MNPQDKKSFFKQVFSILGQSPSKWSVVEVLQFLEIIKCPQFKPIVNQFGINGQMLINHSKIEGIIVPQLKPSTILPFEKLIFILGELNPKQLAGKQNAFYRHSRDTLSIPGNLMKAIRMWVQSLKERSMVLWTTEDLLSFLDEIGFSKFKGIIRQTSCDGFTMLYVVADRRKLIRMSKYFQSKQLQEIVYISQLLLAQYHMISSQEEAEMSDVEFFPRVDSEIAFQIKKIPSTQSICEHSKEYLLAVSQPEIYQQNDFIMSEETDNNSILEHHEPIQNNFIATYPFVRQEELIQEVDKGRENFMFQSMPGDKSEYQQNSLAESEYPEQVRQSLIRSIYPGKEGQLSGSPGLARSEVEDYLASSQLPDQPLAYSEYQPGNLVESKQEQQGMAQSQFSEGEGRLAVSLAATEEDAIGGHRQKRPLCQPSFFDKNQNIFTRQLDQAATKLEELKHVTLEMPFALMSFQNLNSITLAEARRPARNDMSPQIKDVLVGTDGQTFGVKGCKFGRESENDYSYPDEMSISSRHAMVFFRDKKFYLQDLGSKTGTFKQIHRMEIHDGLIIQLAYQVEITFKIISRQTQGTIRVMFNRPPNMPNYQAIIPNKMNCKIGRGQACKIQIDSRNSSVSQKHAEIIYEDQKFTFKDCQSANGSWLRLSEKGQKSELLALQLGDRMRISSKKIFQVTSICVRDL